jgi:hypothetical protein
MEIPKKMEQTVAKTPLILDAPSYAGILCTNPAGRRLWKLVAKGFRSG